MRKPASFIFGICLLAVVLPARAEPQKSAYVYDGKLLQVVNEDLAPAKCSRWQIWFYEEGVRIPRYTAGLQYSRWGLMEGTSEENVMQELESSQRLESAYLKFFGSSTWGRYTFFNPVGPIAVTDQLSEDHPDALEKLYQLRGLDERVSKVIRAATSSLENNQSEDSASSGKNTSGRGRERRAENHRSLAEREVTRKQSLDVARGEGGQRWNSTSGCRGSRVWSFGSEDLDRRGRHDDRHGHYYDDPIR